MLCAQDHAHKELDANVQGQLGLLTVQQTQCDLKSAYTRAQSARAPCWRVQALPMKHSVMAYLQGDSRVYQLSGWIRLAWLGPYLSVSDPSIP